ncbi:MAG: SpoIIE family protein phosphatase, partial [Planctomycetota bacterium]
MPKSAATPPRAATASVSGRRAATPSKAPSAPQSDRKSAAKTGESPSLKTTQNLKGPQRGVTRQNTSDRQGGKPGKSHGSRSGLRMALKTKFMLVMACVTAVAMVLLGLSMGRTANKYLEGQKTQDGIELARMASQIATYVNEQITLTRNGNDPEKKKTLDKTVREFVTKCLEDARSWGGSKEYSDIESIRFDCPQVPELSNAGVGDDADQGVYVRGQRDAFIPKLDRVISQDSLKTWGIQVYEGVKDTPNGQIPILRFKILLDKAFGTNRDNQPANVRVDISKRSVDLVRSNLATTIGIAIFIAIGAVLGIAVWFSSSITRPLEQLLRDMQIVSQGRLNHRTTARSTDEVGLLASEFNQMTASLEEAQSAVIEQEKQAYELSLAREVQQQLLPAQPPLITGYQCHSFYQGAKAVSGDYFDFIPLSDTMWGFIIADVSGKGIPGSMVMAVTRTVVRLVAPQRGQNAAETLKDTNRLIAKQIKRGMFVTSCYAVLDTATGQLTYASAGHNPMVIYRAKTRTAELATTKGIALGFNEGPVFDRTIQLAQTTLERGDAIVLYTDGFPEAMNAKNEEFGDEKFYRLIAANGHLEPPALVD